MCPRVRVSAHGHMHYRHVLPHLAFYMGVTEVGVIPTEVLMLLQVALSLLSRSSSSSNNVLSFALYKGFFFFLNTLLFLRILFFVMLAIWDEIQMLLLIEIADFVFHYIINNSFVC